uniref:ShKT domain-containing protein n=1 Tax=Caenorhabditis japonica TaxID=281687 RepID=A0A8R1EHU8_CAEJA
MIFIIFAFGTLIASTAAQTCANEQSPCIKTKTANNLDVYLCPEGMTCLNNTVCCEYADIQFSTTTTTTVASSTTTTTVASSSKPIPTSICVDKVNPLTGVSDCPRDAFLCNDIDYYKVMTKQCPKTCNRCFNNNNNNNNNNDGCVDQVNPSTGVSECAAKAYLCTRPGDVGLMRKECPKTCGYC